MFKKLALSAIAVFGICSFSLPKALAQSSSCSNYWVNPNNGQEECLDGKMRQVVTEDSSVRQGGNEEEQPSDNNNTDVTQHSSVPQGQNGNGAYIPLNSRKFYHYHSRQNQVHFSPTTSYRPIRSQGSVRRVRGTVGDFGRARSVQRVRSERNTVRINSRSSVSRASSGGSVSRASSRTREHR